MWRGFDHDTSELLIIARLSSGLDHRFKSCQHWHHHSGSHLRTRHQCQAGGEGRPEALDLHLCVLDISPLGQNEKDFRVLAKHDHSGPKGAGRGRVAEIRKVRRVLETEPSYESEAHWTGVRTGRLPTRRILFALPIFERRLIALRA